MTRKAPLYMLGLWLVITLFLWWVAFVPLPAESESWLSSAKSVCFGASPDGLPAAYGWINLIGAPLSLFAAMLVVWREELAAGLKTAVNRPAGMLVMAALATATGWEGAWVAGRIQAGLDVAAADYSARETGPLPASYPRTAKPAAEFSLVDQSGARIGNGALKGKTVFLTFAFAHCRTVCPMIVQQSLEALERIPPERAALVIVTLDPWRDTPSSLPYLAEKWKLPENAHVLSGEVPDVTHVLDRFEVPWNRDEKSGDVSHPALTYVIDPRGRIAYTFNNAPPAWLAEAERRLRAAYAKR